MITLAPGDIPGASLNKTTVRGSDPKNLIVAAAPAGFAGVIYPASITTTVLRQLPESSNCRWPTVRYYDKTADLWRIVWINPVTGALNTLQGRRSGDRIALEGTEAGNPIRWTLEDIKPNRFLFRGEERTKAGAWRLAAEFRLRRIA